MIFCGAPFDEVNCAVLRVRRESRSRNLSVVIARGIHLFPFRTEQLSPSAPMVLGPQGPGRVGRRRLNLRAVRFSGGPFCVSAAVARDEPDIPPQGYARKLVQGAPFGGTSRPSARLRA